MLVNQSSSTMDPMGIDFFELSHGFFGSAIFSCQSGREGTAWHHL
jgi:hypothetical protein